MEMNNIKADRPDNNEPVKQVKQDAGNKPVDALKKAAAEQAAAQKAENNGAQVKRRYIAPDLSGNAELLKDLKKVNEDIRMIDLKKYGYEMAMEKVKNGIAANSAEFYAQLREINGLRSRVEQSSAERLRRIMEIKEKIASGEYKADGMQIVEAMDKFGS